MRDAWRPAPAAPLHLDLVLRPETREADRLRLRAGFRSGALGVGVDLPFNGTKSGESAVSPCSQVPCAAGASYYTDTLQLAAGSYHPGSHVGTGGLRGPHTITDHCVRFTGGATLTWRNVLRRDETEYVMLGRY